MRHRTLILVESPAKAKTIQRFVGTDMLVKPTYGHIRDLPKSVLGVDVHHHFAPAYVIPKKAAPVVRELKAAAKGANAVLLATDPDREGEAIAWHVAEALDLSPTKTGRILFHEITDTAIKQALSEPKKINVNLVDAQQARRVLDRLVGYGLSPLLWQKLYRGLSAGRVQSAALRLVVDREAAIAAFKTRSYWSLWATFTTAKKESFLAKLEKIGRKALAKYPPEKIIQDATKFGPALAWRVARVETEKRQRHPKPPFTTSTLQQAAGQSLGMSVKQTMMHAQKLYEGVELAGETVGLITYMRTDSLMLAESAITEARSEIKKEYGERYLPPQPRCYKTKTKGAQQAHEAIRPTRFLRHPNRVKAHLSAHEFKLYRLIWQRALASQMASADVEVTVAAIEPISPKSAVTYVAHGYHVAFDGYLKVYTNLSDDDPGNERLPILLQNSAVTLAKLEPKRHETEPPPRFSEAALVKEMERLGIGRPSTYAPTISTLLDRGYVVKQESRLVPQDIGTMVIDFLKKDFPAIVDLEFTADMEEKLDDVADGQVEWPKIVGDFYAPLSRQLAVAKKDGGEKIFNDTTNEKCPDCGQPLAIKMSRYGKFFACTGFPKCRYTRPFVADEKGHDQSEELVEGKKCPKDSGDLVVKAGRFGPFIACANYPKCKYIESIKKEIGLNCPKDSGAIVERRTKRGKPFWGCNNYPRCDWASWDKPVAKKCPTCHNLMVEKQGEIVCPACAKPAVGRTTMTQKPKTKATQRAQ